MIELELLKKLGFREAALCGHGWVHFKPWPIIEPTMAHDLWATYYDYGDSHRCGHEGFHLVPDFKDDPAMTVWLIDRLSMNTFPGPRGAQTHVYERFIEMAEAGFLTPFFPAPRKDEMKEPLPQPDPTPGSFGTVFYERGHPPTIVRDHHDGFGLNDRIDVEAVDRDDNGVPHRYNFLGKTEALGEVPMSQPGFWQFGFLQFQKGPRNVPGSIPGLTTDAVLVALIHHLSGFQNGPFKSRETALVITKLEEALHWSQARAKDRARRGVLGHNKP